MASETMGYYNQPNPQGDMLEGIGTTGGAAIGTAFGGPVGGAIGGALGGALGRALGGGGKKKKAKIKIFIPNWTGVPGASGPEVLGPEVQPGKQRSALDAGISGALQGGMGAAGGGSMGIGGGSAAGGGSGAGSLMGSLGMGGGGGMAGASSPNGPPIPEMGPGWSDPSQSTSVMGNPNGYMGGVKNRWNQQMPQWQSGF